MAKSYFPFDSGAGANSTETRWTAMARKFFGTGVIPNELNTFEVYADSSGLQCKVKSGRSWTEGHYYESDAEEIIAVPANSSGSTRIDLIAIEVDWTTNIMSTVRVAGTPGAGTPALTTNTAKWQVKLATLTIPTGTTVSITAGMVADNRVYCPEWKSNTDKEVHGLYVVGGVHVAESPGAGFYRGLRTRSGGAGLELVNSVGANATPWISFCQSDGSKLEKGRMDVNTGVFLNTGGLTSGTGALGATGGFINMGDFADASNIYVQAGHSVNANMNIQIQAKGAGTVILTNAGGTVLAQTNTPTGNFLGWSVRNAAGTVKTLEVGATDSGGVGYRLVRVSN